MHDRQTQDEACKAGRERCGSEHAEAVPAAGLGQDRRGIRTDPPEGCVAEGHLTQNACHEIETDAQHTVHET